MKSLTRHTKVCTQHKKDACSRHKAHQSTIPLKHFPRLPLEEPSEEPSEQSSPKPPMQAPVQSAQRAAETLVLPSATLPVRLGMRLTILCLLAAILCLSGCATRKNADTSVHGQTLVDRSLNESANAIMADLARLNGSWQSYGQPRAASPLRMRMDLVFEGPVQHALEKICAHTGFRLVTKGRQRSVPLIVHVRARQTEALQILRLIGLQTSAGEQIRVLEQEKIIELVWLSREEQRTLPR